MGSDPQYAKYPDLSLAQDIFTLTNSSTSKSQRQAALKKLKDAISEHKMAPLYRHLAHPVEGLLNSAGTGSSASTKSASSRGRRMSGLAGVAVGAVARDVSMDWDEKFYDSLVKENEEELKAFEKEEEDAAENAGDVEVLQAKGKKAEFWAKVLDKV